MLDQSRTRVESSREADILSTAVVNMAGLTMQAAYESSEQKCMPSNATDNTTFMGFSWGDRFPTPSTAPMVELLTAATVGSYVSIFLSHVATSAADMTIITGSDAGGDTGTAMTSTTGTTPSSSQFSLQSDGQTVILNAAALATPVFVQYRFALTVQQASFYYGDQFPGSTATMFLMKAGMITKGFVYTDQFDASIDWASTFTPSSSLFLRGGANGRVTYGSTGGCILTSAEVVSTPSVGDPWLGLYVNR